MSWKVLSVHALRLVCEPSPWRVNRIFSPSTAIFSLKHFAAHQQAHTVLFMKHGWIMFWQHFNPFSFASLIPSTFQTTFSSPTLFLARAPTNEMFEVSLRLLLVFAVLNRSVPTEMDFVGDGRWNRERRSSRRRGRLKSMILLAK